MKIVIDIPEEMYDRVLDGTYCGTLYEELKNGTPLPTGHGRLIEADVLEKIAMEEDSFGYVSMGEIADAPTIIEADKE